MSGEVVGWAMRQLTGSPAAKLVLVKLADNANDDGYCWPSLETIVEHTELGQSTVYKHLATLQELELITPIEQFTTPQGYVVRAYKLAVPGVEKEEIPPRRKKGTYANAIPRGGKDKKNQNSIPQGGKKSLSDGKSVPPAGTHIEEPSLEPSENLQDARDARDGEVSPIGEEAEAELEFLEFARCPGFNDVTMTREAAFRARRAAVTSGEWPGHAAVLGAIRAYAGWLVTENARRLQKGGDLHRMKSPAGWYAEKRWGSYVRATADDARHKAASAAKAASVPDALRAALRRGGIPDTKITAWFAGCEVEEGQRVRLILPTRMIRDHVARDFPQRLMTAFPQGYVLDFAEKREVC